MLSLIETESENDGEKNEVREKIVKKTFGILNYLIKLKYE